MSFDPEKYMVPAALPTDDYMPSGMDVADPVWPSSPIEPPATNQAVDYQPEIRTIHGPLDLLQKVEEETEDWIERETGHGAGHRRGQQLGTPLTIPTLAQAASSWRGVTFNVDHEIEIVQPRKDRTRVIVTNWGPGILYLSHESSTMPSGVSINNVQIAVNASREFRTKGSLWASPAILGTAQVVDIQDEYGHD